MRFKHRLRGKHARKPGMKGDWLVLAHSGCPVLGPTPQDCQDEADINDVFEIAFLNSADLIEKEDSMTIVRQVGEIQHFMFTLFEEGSVPSNTLVDFLFTIDEGIYLSTVNASGITTPLDPRTSADAELDSWLWRRRLLVNFDALNAPKEQWWSNGDYWGPMSPHLDIRSKRKLVRGNELIYCCGTTFSRIGAVATGTIVTGHRISFNMRGYVKF